MSKLNRSYYAIIPASVRYDKNIPPNAKLLYGEITALCNERGYCWAENRYFSELYGVSNRSISIWINCLQKFGYIKSELVRNDKTKEVEKRIITIAYPIEENFHTYGKNLPYPIEENFHTLMKKSSIPMEENFADNNTSNNTLNNTSNNTINNRFVKPTIEQVKSYCAERNNGVDAERFIDYYESNGWKVGKNSMKDWKAAIRTWERNEKKEVGEKRDYTDYSESPF